MSMDRQVDSVATDMERIFRPLAGRVAAPLSARDEGAGIARRPASRWLTLGAPLLVVATAGALGVTYVRDVWRPQAAVPALPDMRVGYRTAPSPSLPPSLPPMETAATPAPAAADVSAAADTSPSVMPAAAPPPRYVREARAPRPPFDVARAAPRRDEFFRPEPMRRVTVARASLPECAPDSLEDRCIYQDVLDADGRLRDAYRRAREDGVPGRHLAAIGRRWRQAREVAQDDPDGAIRRYDRLADRLDDLRRGAVE